MERSHETWPLVSVYHYKNKINPTPKYQRYAVWSRQQQQLLMDSIFRGLDIPKLYLRQINEGGPFKYEAVDGQQRLRCVWEFFDNQFSLDEKVTPPLGGKRYQDMEMEDRSRFEHYQFNLVIIKEAADDEIRDMFCRLQNGKPLNSAEKRNAMVSAMRDFCANLAEHEFFKSVRFKNARMQFHQVAAQTVLLELQGGAADCKDANLARLYEAHRHFDSSSPTARRLIKVYDYLCRCFPERMPELKRGYVVSLYLLVADLMKQYQMDGHEEDLRKFLIQFECRRRDQEKDTPQMLRFTSALSHTSDGKEAISSRHRVLKTEFLDSCPTLQPLPSSLSA